MNETKKKILEASRGLYNEQGVGKVSQRKVAEQLGISPGNLTYHFKKSEDIVEALYFELVETIDLAMTEVKSLAYDLNFMFKMIDKLVDSFFEYRFFFLDFVQVMRSNERIRKHYGQLAILRKQQFDALIAHLTSTQIMRAEELPHEYDFLYERFQILADFWISSVEIKEEGVKKEQLEKYKKVIVQSLYPYLSQQGKKAFLAVYGSV